jgi:hypothetical protein
MKRYFSFLPGVGAAGTRRPGGSGHAGLAEQIKISAGGDNLAALNTGVQGD